MASDSVGGFGNVVEHIGDLLPLRLTEADVKQNPDLIKLLNALGSHHIKPDGVSKTMHKDLLQAEKILTQAKGSWLEQQILYLELQEMLLDYELKSHDVKLSPSDNQFQMALRECLTLGEIGDYLECGPNPTTKTTLFNLTKADLDGWNPHKQSMQPMIQKMIPEVEDRLRKKCEKLLAYHSPPSMNENRKVTFAKSSQLPIIIEDEIRKLAESKKLLKKYQKLRDKQFWCYFQTMLDSMEILQRFLMEYKLRNQSKFDKAREEHLVAWSDGLCLKLKMVQLQVLFCTYNAETIQALKVVRQHLDSSIKDTERDDQALRQSLHSYESVSSEFNGIVEEYGQSLREIDNKQWALEELVQSSSSG